MTLAATVLALLSGGCSNDSGGAEDTSSGVAATTVCDGALDGSASDALKRLAGTNRFDQSSGTGEEGEQSRFTLSKVVKHLHDEYRKRSACWVYKSGDDSGDPLLEVRFSASRSHPSTVTKQPGSGKTRFSLGAFAQVGPSGADLFFRCSTKAPSKDSYIGNTNYVKAEMYFATAKTHGDSVDKDRMVILNSVSRAVAREAGCSSEADLPRVVPDR